MGRKSKIEASLAPEQITELFRRLAQLKNPTLENIIAVAGEFDVELTLSSATTTRDHFEQWLDRVQDRARKVEMITATLSGSSASPLEGAAAIAQNELFDLLVDSDGDPEILAEASKIIQRLTVANTRSEALKIMQARHEREREQWADEKRKLAEAVKSARSEGGIREETLKRIEETIGLL